MYKKVLSICLSIILVFGILTVFSSCGTDVSEGAKKYGYDHTDKENMISFISNYAKTQSDGISTKSETLLTSLGEDYSTYLENKSSVSSFLQETGTITDDIFMAYKYVCIDYCKLIAAEDFDYYDYEGALESLTGATEKGFEGYCGNLEDAVEDVIKKCEYLIETAEDDVDYDELSDEADEIYEILSDGYDSLYEKVSDYYEYLYDLIEKVYESFSEGKKDVDKIVENLKAPVVESTTEQAEKTTVSDSKKTEQTTEQPSESNVPKADSVDALEATIIKYVEDEIAGLNAELTVLAEKTSTYNKYVKNIEDVEAFYEKVNTTSEEIAIRLCEYSVVYAEMIIDSDMSADDMYDALDDLYDCIYEDAADALYDGIYDGILEEMYDTFYDGVVSEGVDTVNYSDWYDVSSDAYELWYDTSSDCYEHWYDMKSDVYGFWSDVKGEVFSKDIAGAEEEIADFKEDIKT